MTPTPFGASAARREDASASGRRCCAGTSCRPASPAGTGYATSSPTPSMTRGRPVGPQADGLGHRVHRVAHRARMSDGEESCEPPCRRRPRLQPPARSGLVGPPTSRTKAVAQIGISACCVSQMSDRSVIHVNGSRVHGTYLCQGRDCGVGRPYAPTIPGHDPRRSSTSPRSWSCTASHRSRSVGDIARPRRYP